MPETKKEKPFDGENISDILESLGFVQIADHKWSHKDFSYIFDFTGAKKDKVLFRLSSIFEYRGYEKCQADFRRLIGLQ